MAYEGWFTFGGTEIVNGPRTMAYVRTLMPGTKVIDTCVNECGCDHLHAFLGDSPYASPLADDAPWTDPDRPESYEFLGVYPVDVDNLVDGTVTATVTPSINGGGTISGRRDAAREVVFTAALFSTTQDGDDYGMAWLKAALEGACEDPCNSSAQLCFLSACADPETFTGRVVDTEHTLAEWNLYRSTWTDRTINLMEQTSFAEINVAGSCGEIEWELTIRGEAGNYVALRHPDRDELILLTGADQTIRVTTAGTALRLGIPDVSDYASWKEPDDGDTLVLEDFAHIEDTDVSVEASTQATWTQFTTIPLPIRIVQVISHARFSTTDDECAAEYMRYLRRVANTGGPITRSKNVLSDGGVVRTVEFVLTAEKPYIYGEPSLAAKGTSTSLVAMAVPYRTMRLQRNINDCVPSPVAEVRDPLGPIVPPPPPPSLALEPSPSPTVPAKNPYAVLIPGSTIPQWLNSVPIVTITAGSKDVREVRVRFFPVPLDSYLPGDIDPCSACGSFQIDYLPAGAKFTFDGADQRATVSVGGIEQSASHLLSGDRGIGGASWPLLSCGVPYMVLIDSREQPLSDVEVEMVVRS